MLIESILSLERTQAKIEGSSKKRVLETLAQVFAESVEGLDVEQLYQSFINREKLGTTGIGGGIAIPHCRFNTGGETFGACLTLNQPVDFDAVDNEPVDIVFAMLVPENAESSHLELLAKLAERLQTPNYVKQLRAADNNEALFHVASSPLP